MFSHILVPTDGSELSLKAIRGAVEFAKAIGARVTGYVCLEEYPQAPMTEFVVERADEYVERMRSYAHSSLLPLEQAAANADVPCQTDTSSARTPYLGIIDAAKRHGCDVIFMASHGRSGLAGFLLGSETQRVLTHTDIPVLVYR